MQLGVSLGIPYTLGKPAAAFSPLDLSPVLWLDASDTSTITESGGSVSQWDDKSGNGYNVTQATAAAQPTTGVTTQNGKNVLDFSSDRLDAASASDWVFLHDGSPSSVFIVFKPDGNGALDLWVQTTNDSASTASRGYQLSVDDRSGIRTDNLLLIVGSGTSNVVFNGADSSITMSAWSLVSVAADADASPAADRSIAYVNGSLSHQNNTVTASPSALDPASSLRIGSLGAYAATGSVAEVIIYDSILSASNRAAVDTYLADKWGITI